VPWQNNSSAKTCYLCSDDFTLINRRHHCRLCGRIICSSPLCMENIPIKLENCLVKELKSCVKCFKFLFKKPQTRNQSLTEEKINSLFRVNSNNNRKGTFHVILFVL
jgi:rabenosyn-5